MIPKLICIFLQKEIIAAIIGAIISVTGFLLISSRQNKLAKKNQFEVTFFNLLLSIRDLVNSISGEINSISEIEAKKKSIYDNSAGVPSDEPYDTTPRGQKFFKEASSILKNCYMKDYLVDIEVVLELQKPDNENDRIDLIKKKAMDAYNDFFNKHVSQLGHYCRYVFNIIKYVDRSKIISNEDKHFYINFIQAQMSSGELALLFYNGIGQHGGKFYDYMKIYNEFFQNLDPETIYEPNIHFRFYPNHKFGFVIKHPPPHSA